MMTSSSIFKKVLPSSIDTLTKVEQIIEDLRQQFAIPEELYGNILVAVTEAVNNAIKHGNQFISNKVVEIEFNENDKEYSFIIEDQGVGFDPNSIPDPTHPDNIDKIDGRGIFIMTNLADDVQFDNNGRTVKISFLKA